MGFRALGRTSGLIDASLKYAKFRASVLNLGASLEVSSSKDRAVAGVHLSAPARPGPGRAAVHLLISALIVPCKALAGEGAHPLALVPRSPPPHGQEA